MVSHQHTHFIFAFHQTCFPSPFLLLSLLPLLSISNGQRNKPWYPFGLKTMKNTSNHHNSKSEIWSKCKEMNKSVIIYMYIFKLNVHFLYIM